MRLVAGVDLGGTAINYTLVNEQGQFLIEGLCEYPSRAKEGPDICLQQIADGLKIAVEKAEVKLSDVVAAGLDTPGPASATGVFSTKGSTNFVHANWRGYDIRHNLARKIGIPVSYLNDGNAAALWGHASIFGTNSRTTSDFGDYWHGLGRRRNCRGQCRERKNGFGGELGHVLIPFQSIPGTDGMDPKCNCGRTGDLESLCSLTAIEKVLLPTFLARNPSHELSKIGQMHQAAKLVRGLAEKGDPLCKQVFRVQAQALGLFFDEMVSTFDPDALIVGGGAIETGKDFQDWFISEIRAAMPNKWEEQIGIPIYIMPNGDTAGARGAAIEALKLTRQGGQGSASGGTPLSLAARPS